MSGQPGGITELVAELSGRREANTTRRQYRQDHPRASGIGLCSLEVLNQVRYWDRRPPPSPELQQRFDAGNVWERETNRMLMADGWDIAEQNVPFEIREDVPPHGNLIICTGHCDGVIRWNGRRIVYDVKSLHPNIYARVNTWQDFTRMGDFWTKYPRQMLIYLYHYAEPDGLFVLTDCMGHYKFVPLPLEPNLQLCEDALRTARSAAVARIAGTELPFLANRPDVCLRCWCRKAGVCNPPLEFQAGASIEDDFEIEAAMERMDELEPGATEYADLDKLVKKRFHETPDGQVIVGDWLVTVKRRETTRYDVPPVISAPYAKQSQSVFTSWSRLNGSKKPSAASDKATAWAGA